MGFKMNVDYGSHLPVLMKLLSITDGPVLECGTGLYSTAVIHWYCVPDKRLAVSYDNDPRYFSIPEQYRCDYHEVHLIEDWDSIDIEKPWDIVFIDHSPGSRRKEEARRVANFAKFVILHDSEHEQRRRYRYERIYPLFKYRYDYTLTYPHTTVLSNFIDLETIKLAQ